MHRKAFLASILFSCCVLGCCESHTQNLTDRFDRGLSSWQSFPLAQDVGYDPSVYTEQTPLPAIVREVVNEGEATDEVGLIRSVRMNLKRESVITLSCIMNSAGQLISTRVLVSSSSGRKYDLTLKSEQFKDKGVIKISGEQLGLPAQGVDADAIAVAYTMRGAALGSHSYLKLSRFEVVSPAADSIALISPKIEESSAQVAPIVGDVATVGVALNLVFDRSPERLELFDGDGNLAPMQVAIQGKNVTWVPRLDARPGLWTMKAYARRGVESLRILLLPKGSAKDGGGILSQARLTQIKDDPAFVGLRRQIRVKAEKSASLIAYNSAAGDNIALLPRESVLAGLESYLHLMTNYGGAVAWNALDYRINGNTDSFEHARKALLATAQWKIWTPTWFVAHGIQTYYVAGVFTEQVAFAYNLLGPSLTAEERNQISSAIWSKSIHPAVQDYYLSNRMPTGSSNHMAHSVGGAIAAWVAIDSYDTSWRKKHGDDLAALIVAYEDLLRGLFPGDGSEAEPAGYDNFAMEGMSYGIAALDGLGIAPQGTNMMKESFWWLRYARVTPHLILDTGDTSSNEGDLYGFSWLAEHSGNAAVQHLYETSRAVSVTEDVPNLLDLVCCTKPSQERVPEVPASRVFAARGSAALRSGWKENDTVLSMRLGPWMNHEHHDQSSFQIANDGELLVGEGGYANYYRDPNYKNYFIEAPAHNTVLVDHNAFSQSPYDGRYWASLTKFPKIDRSLLGKHFDYLRGDLQPAYGTLLRRYRRTVVYLKPGFFVIDDELSSTTPHVFTWQLHPAGRSTVGKDGTVELEGSQGKTAAVLTAVDPAERWRIERVPIPALEFEDIDARKIQERHNIETDSPPTTSHEFLESIAIDGGAAGQEKVSRFETKTGKGFRLVSEDGSTIFLKRSHEGALVADEIDVDGDMMAVARRKGETHIFAADARSLQLRNGLSLKFSQPVLLMIDVHDSVADLKVSAFSERTELHIEGAAEDSVKADGGGGMIRLSSGEKEMRLELAHH